MLRLGYSRDDILVKLKSEIGLFKDIPDPEKERLAHAILEEIDHAKVPATSELIRKILTTSNSGASMHDLGVGCRGEGDFFVHGLIAELVGEGGVLNPNQQDDAGAVDAGCGKFIVCAVDGTHSRLSDFPFIAGFHVARAAIRDVVVKGGRPVALLDDLHLSDDGDVAKLFDFVAGVSAVAKLSGVPLVAGSTLRTGGDMVIGDRMVSGVACVGIANRLLRRSDVCEGDAILMGEGAGGGTIATTAIYSGKADVAEKTINVDFIDAVSALGKEGLMDKIHCMLDVTNGGLRGDCAEVCKTAGVGMELSEKNIKELVDSDVLMLLEEEGVDYLGVSLDSILIFCSQGDKESVLKGLKKHKIRINEIGKVTGGSKATLDGKEFIPHFRESAYTKIKREVGESASDGLAELKEGAIRAVIESKAKETHVIEYVRRNRT